MFMFLIFCVVAVVSIGVWTGLNALVAGQCKAAEIVKGACSGLVQAGVVFLATSAHPWLALMALIVVAALAVFYVCWAFRISAYGIRRIVGIFAIFAILLPTFWATVEAIRTAVGPATIIGSVILLFGRVATIVVVGLIVARILSTFGRSVLVKVVVAIAAVLVVAAVVFAVYEGVSALDFHSFKGEKAAVSAVDESEGNFILRWLKGLSNDETDVVEDESSVAEVEVDNESVTAEVADEFDAEAETAEKVETGKATEGRVIKCDTYTQVVKDHPEFHVHNYDLILDDIPYNNSYFTESIYEEGDTEDAVYKKFETIIRECPLTFVQFYAAQAAARKTDVLGEYYANNDAEWAKAINAMVQDFFDSPSDFVNHRRVLLDMLANERVGLELKHFDDIKDQFYVDSYTVSGVPRIVVCETHQSGWVLIIWLRTKGNDPRNDVGIGIDTGCGNVCGFYKRDESPTPVSEEMNIPVQEVPEMPEGYDPPTPTPKPEPTVTPTPTPVPGGGSDSAKDPSKAPKENTERNDDPGTGSSTNSGSGSTKSAAASESQKASDGGSVEDYDGNVERNRSANAGGSSSGGSGGSGSGSSGGQKLGGESNKPSQSVPEAKQDNNGNAGNGSGSIDEPTVKTETAVSADTNRPVDEPGSAGGIIEIPD